MQTTSLSRRAACVRLLAAVLALWWIGPGRAAAQGADGQRVRPAVEARRAATGRLVVEAVASTVPVTLDGVLDDPVWRAAPVTGFVQAEPDEGRPATERTEVWVAYDGATLYIAAYLHDSRPDALIVSDIRKDFRTDTQDTFEVILDTFADRRNGYVFATNPGGGRADEQITNEGREVNPSWDAPWTVQTKRVPDGWTVEMAIPFRALRQGGETGGQWGINFSRRIRRKNEVAYWAPVPRAYALTRLSLAGDLVGIPARGGGRDLRVTPYALARTVRPEGAAAFAEGGDAGVDIKFGLTNGLTLDVTVNPDFAQAEADVQTVNLTQFSQFFPEKRDFFLENSGEFYLGDTPRNRRIASAPSGDEDLLLFFSRRMGLGPDGLPVGIDGGIRLTGQAEGFHTGALVLRTRDRDTVLGSDYAVLRLRRDILSSSDVGAIFMMRSTVDDRGDFNRVYGADANIRLPARIDWSSYAVNSETDGVSGATYAFQTSLNREANFLHVKAGLLSIGENFNDELGFMRRTGARMWSLDVGVRPRLRALRARGVREMHPHVVWNYVTDQNGTVIARRMHNGYTFFLNNGGFGELSHNPRSERLTSAFAIDPAVQPLAAGDYDWTEWRLFMGTDPSRTLALALTALAGGLWNGTQQTVNASVTLQPSYRVRATLGLSRTAADLEGPGETFVREIWTLRANYSFTTNMFVDALAQYDPSRDQVSMNVRFNLIHHPLSNLYLVYNESRTTGLDAPASGRSIIIKATQMLAF
ncbi:MAG TPA: DUF5916 domain-containing protein [Gemmatimonadales bacterium]